MKKPLRLTAFWLCTLIVIAIATPVFADQPLPGAIFTTDAGCGSVDLNIYSDKGAVYLSGGPKKSGAPNLPDGSYYVRVTDPSGATVLGTSVGTANPMPYSVTSGVPSCLPVASIVVYPTTNLPGYDDSPNSGSEYKLWVSTDSLFKDNSTKTDNFKVLPNGLPPNLSISGLKFYDANLDGKQDNGELGINAWQVNLYQFNQQSGQYDIFAGNDVTHTVGGIDGTFSFDNLSPSTYAACEVIPSATPTWVPTTATSANGLIPPATIAFGNVCLKGGSSLTLGFWSNKNGQKLITGTQLCLLNSLSLVNGSGAIFDPVAGCPSPTSTQVSAGATNLKNWLLSASATNMAYMLSAQLATMELNTTDNVNTSPSAFQDPSAYVYVNSNGNNTAADCSAVGVTLSLVNPNGFSTVANLMSAANAAIGVTGGTNTTKGSPLRKCQQDLEQALDDANNNKVFVSATACTVNYAATDTCTP